MPEGPEAPSKVYSPIDGYANSGQARPGALTLRLAHLAEEPDEESPHRRISLRVDQKVDGRRYEASRMEVPDRLGTGRIVGGEYLEEVHAIGGRDPRDGLAERPIGVLKTHQPDRIATYRRQAAMSSLDAWRPAARNQALA
jgi:hypothetical protein